MKNYVKPELFYESYELSQNIAACGWDMNVNGTPSLNTPETCKATGDLAFGNPAVVVFANNEVCELIVQEYCYENGGENNAWKVFNS